MLLVELEVLYSGMVVFVKCCYCLDGWVGDYVSVLFEYWFFGLFKWFWCFYVEVIVVVLVVNVLVVVLVLFVM